MGGRIEDTLSRRQRQMVEAVASCGTATVQDVHDRIPDPPTTNAVRTTLGTLVDRGVLRRRRAGREATYELREGSAALAARALRRLLRSFFGGSMADAVALHLSGDSADIDDGELERIERMAKERRLARRAARRGGRS